MSILIKGMPMPKDCWSCPCSSKQYGYCEITDERFLDSRPQSCPLIELPPHGRLIDADALNELINQSYPMTDRADVHNGYAIVQEMIKQLPTIIESEGKE